jgi:polysaccharide export outer membrane protein
LDENTLFRNHCSPGRSARIAAITTFRVPTVALAFILSCTGCASQNYPLLDVAEANSRLSTGYRLGAGDRLRVTVFDEPSLSGEYEVGVAGAITLPLVSDVPAINQTQESLAQAIAAKLKAGSYVLNPRVAVDILGYRPFYILGEVNKPGEYTAAGGLSLLQAIAKAGGFTARADRANVILRRPGFDSGLKVRVSDPPLIIAPGDTVMVTESTF